MNLSPVFLMKFKNTVERILHVPGNYNGGILEMAIVLDANVEKETIKELVPQLLRSLKTHSEVFRNVRFNLVWWKSDEQITGQVTPMSMAALPTYYDAYEVQRNTKDIMNLVQYLKLFQARAKLIILITDGTNEESSKESIKAAMQPFLDKELMKILVGETLEVQYRQS